MRAGVSRFDSTGSPAVTTEARPIAPSSCLLPWPPRTVFQHTVATPENGAQLSTKTCLCFPENIVIFFSKHSDDLSGRCASLSDRSKIPWNDAHNFNSCATYCRDRWEALRSITLATNRYSGEMGTCTMQIGIKTFGREVSPVACRRATPPAELSAPLFPRAIRGNRS